PDPKSAAVQSWHAGFRQPRRYPGQSCARPVSKPHWYFARSAEWQSDGGTRLASGVAASAGRVAVRRVYCSAERIHPVEPHVQTDAEKLAAQVKSSSSLDIDFMFERFCCCNIATTAERVFSRRTCDPARVVGKSSVVSE